MSGADSDTASAINEALISSVETGRLGDPANVVDGLFAFSRAIQQGFKWLGTGDAATQMGAIEFLAVSIKEAGEHIGDGLTEIANAIREHE